WKLETIFHTEEWVRCQFLSALRHAAFSFFSSGVNQGLDSLTVLVVKGACLSSRRERVLVYCSIRALRSAEGDFIRVEFSRSLQNCSMSILFIRRNDLMEDLGTALVLP